MNVLDLFAGPGGWDVAAHELGHEPVGIEWDDAACQTREAAGLLTVQGDVAAQDPKHYDPVDLLIASPPCQAWSMAGNRAGQEDIARVHEVTEHVSSTGERIELEGWADPRSELVVEPLRWALALRPRWIALEQVPPVLEYWRHVGEILRREGWNVWCGILSAERYGVPQTRKRAILMADSDGPVHPPLPTHQEYRAGEPAWESPQLTLEGELLPWVSMAQALRWNEGLDVQHRRSGDRLEEEHSADRPSDTVSTRVNRWQVNTGRDWKEGGTREDAQQFDADERPAPAIDGKGRWRVGFARQDDGRGEATEDGYRERDFRDGDEPAFNLTEKARSWERLETGANTRSGEAPHRHRPEGLTRDAEQPAPTLDGTAGNWKLRAGTGEKEAERDEDEPAPTIRFGGRLNTVEWKMRMDGQPNATERGADEPAPTMIGGHDYGNRVWTPEHLSDEGWEEHRPATTLAGDPRIFPPGGHTANDGRNNDAMVGRPEGAKKVSIEEAAQLQSFPPGYPWSGSRTKKFEQIGNAVPPLLALRVLEALIR